MDQKVNPNSSFGIYLQGVPPPHNQQPHTTRELESRPLWTGTPGTPRSTLVGSEIIFPMRYHREVNVAGQHYQQLSKSTRSPWKMALSFVCFSLKKINGLVSVGIFQANVNKKKTKKTVSVGWSRLFNTNWKPQCRLAVGKRAITAEQENKTVSRFTTLTIDINNTYLLDEEPAFAKRYIAVVWTEIVKDEHSVDMKGEGQQPTFLFQLVNSWPQQRKMEMNHSLCVALRL